MELTAALNVPLAGERRRFDGQTLVGSRCEDAARRRCPLVPSASAAEPRHQPRRRSPSTGQLVTFTTVHVGRPGMPAPYTLGQVTIDDAGPLVFGQVRAQDGRLAAGLPVRVVIGSAGETPRYWFMPV